MQAPHDSLHGRFIIDSGNTTVNAAFRIQPSFAPTRAVRHLLQSHWMRLPPHWLPCGCALARWYLLMLLQPCQLC